MGNGNKDGCLQRINMTILILLAIKKLSKYKKGGANKHQHRQRRRTAGRKEIIRGDQPCGVVAPQPIGAAQKNGMRQPPRREGGAEGCLERLIAAEPLEHQTFSNRSTLVTKMVAPPTVTSSGKAVVTPTP